MTSKRSCVRLGRGGGRGPSIWEVSRAFSSHLAAPDDQPAATPIEDRTSDTEMGASLGTLAGPPLPSEKTALSLARDGVLRPLSRAFVFLH